MVKSNFNTLLFLLIVVFSGCGISVEPNDNQSTTTIKKDIHIFKTAYGINVDSLIIITDNVKRNEFLSDILLRYNIDYRDIDFIARKTKDVFDVRKIIAGNKYSVIYTDDSLKKVLYFAYELSPSKYVIYSFFDTIVAKRGEKEIVTAETTTMGTISSSLWNAMVDNNSDPNLANELSEIYAWTIDFFGLQKGDTYKVIFEEQFVDTSYIGLGKVVATLVIITES